jgi:hypothetical protein
MMTPEAAAMMNLSNIILNMTKAHLSLSAGD